MMDKELINIIQSIRSFCVYYKQKMLDLYLLKEIILCFFLFATATGTTTLIGLARTLLVMGPASTRVTTLLGLAAVLAFSCLCNAWTLMSDVSGSVSLACVLKNHNMIIENHKFPLCFVISLHFSYLHVDMRTCSTALATFL